MSDTRELMQSGPQASGVESPTPVLDLVGKANPGAFLEGGGFAGVRDLDRGFLARDMLGVAGEPALAAELLAGRADPLGGALGVNPQFGAPDRGDIGILGAGGGALPGTRAATDVQGFAKTPGQRSVAPDRSLGFDSTRGYSEGGCIDSEAADTFTLVGTLQWLGIEGLDGFDANATLRRGVERMYPGKDAASAISRANCVNDQGGLAEDADQEVLNDLAAFERGETDTNPVTGEHRETSRDLGPTTETGADTGGSSGQDGQSNSASGADTSSSDNVPETSTPSSVDKGDAPESRPLDESRSGMGIVDMAKLAARTDSISNPGVDGRMGGGAMDLKAVRSLFTNIGSQTIPAETDRVVPSATGQDPELPAVDSTLVDPTRDPTSGTPTNRP